MRSSVKVDIAGKEFNLASDDDYLGHVEGTFEPETTRILSSLACGTVLDIGANIGVTTILHGSLAKHVHAFEPSPSTFKFLEENVATAQLTNVSCHNFGLGRAAGKFELTFSPNNRSGAFVSDQTRASSGHTVETIHIQTLDAFVAESNLQSLDFMKIDVEGFEGHVLHGGSKSLAKFRPAVALELNHWCLNAFQRTSVPDFLDQLVGAFPIVLAVHQDHHLDVNDQSSRYAVMHRHILHSWYQTLVCAYEPTQIEKLIAEFPRATT